ncbi:MAG: stage III sporulation protein AG, partial [Eubacteriales bacterium]|nr:stage III sporulation protein AG [Eubacteriales bacterium]
TEATVSKENTRFSYEDYMEEKLEYVLSNVDVVGKVKVIISFKNTGEKIIAQDENNSSENIQETDSSGGVRSTNQNSSEITNIYYDSEAGSEPYVKSENMPEVEGVIIVAQGGGDGVIAANITSAVESLLGVPVHKVKVLKMS